jgi:hypothetical protein
MSMKLATGAILLVLGACASPAPAPAPERVAGPAPAPPAPRPVAVVRDRCGAWELQNLVGRPRTEIPVPVHPERQRVACTTCPVTQDLNPERLNFFFDAESGAIREIRCG